MSSEIWKIEKNLCRCCHTEGTFKSLGMPCEEQGLLMYCDMLQDCFDLNLTQVDSPIGQVTYTICDACILRLKDACSFKKQVRCCEDRFIEMYKNNFIKVEIKEEAASPCYDRLGDCHNSNDFIAFEPEDNFQVTVKVEYAEEPKKKARGKHKKQKRKSDKDSDVSNTVKKVNKPDQEPPNEKPKKSRQTATRFQMQRTDYKMDGDMYACAHCDKRYDKRHSMRFHLKTKHYDYKLPKFVCHECGKEFMTLAPLSVHKLEAHAIDERFKCNACDGVFNTKVQLRKHINNFHMLGEKFKCESCDYESFSFEGMYKHKFKHKTVKDYHCRFCTKQFLRKATLQLHERIHTGDRRKVCRECGQAFVQKASLNYHMAKYHPEVNF